MAGEATFRGARRHIYAQSYRPRRYGRGRSLRRVLKLEVPTTRAGHPPHDHERSGQAERSRRADAPRSSDGVGRDRSGPPDARCDRRRRREGVLGRRRPRPRPGDGRGLRGAHPCDEGGARPRLQRDRLLEADRVRDARSGGRRRPGDRAARRCLHSVEDRAHHRRAYAARRCRRRPRCDRVATAVWDGEGEIPPADL